MECLQVGVDLDEDGIPRRMGHLQGNAEFVDCLALTLVQRKYLRVFEMPVRSTRQTLAGPKRYALFLTKARKHFREIPDGVRIARALAPWRIQPF